MPLLITKTGAIYTQENSCIVTYCFTYNAAHRINGSGNPQARGNLIF